MTPVPVVVQCHLQEMTEIEKTGVEGRFGVLIESAPGKWKPHFL